VAGLARAYGLAYARVTRADALEPALRYAATARGTGRTAVVEVSVDLRDVPPGMESLAGDFPAPRPAGPIPADPAGLAGAHSAPPAGPEAGSNDGQVEVV
jgi:hypothetical protein